jgi:hypothetical protein
MSDPPDPKFYVVQVRVTFNACTTDVTVEFTYARHLACFLVSEILGVLRELMTSSFY